jgi:methylmalonyl-CoA epimerase
MAVTGIRRIDHIAIAVRDIDAALRFYRDTLGITPSVIQDVHTEGVRIAFLPMGGPDGSKIELIQPLDPANSIGRFLDKHGEGQHHICLQVADIVAALAELQADGAPVLDQTPRVSAEGRAIFIHPKGTNGVLIELVEVEH